MTTKRPKTAPAFDLSQIQRPRRTVTREIDYGLPFTVEIIDLSTGETNAIEFKPSAPVENVMKQIAPYIVGWTFKAEDKTTGELIDVPPPAEYGWEVLDLLNSSEVGDLISWVKWPHNMEQLVEKKRALEEAKRLKQTGTTTASGSRTSTVTPTRPKPAT